MKKGMRSVLCMVLSIALMTGLLSGIVTAPKAQAETAAAIEPPVLTDFAASVIPSQSTVTLPGNTTASPETIVPVNVAQAGVVVFGITATGAAVSIEMGLYSDQNCSTSVGSVATLAAKSTKLVSQQYQIANAGTYYLRFKWTSAAPAAAASILIQSFAYRGEGVTLNESFQAVYSGNGSSPLYHKLVVKKAGVVILTGNTYQEIGENLQAAELSVRLCNKKKTPLYNARLNSLNSYSEKFVLKKGTYYIEVTSSLRYQLKSSFTKWKDQSGTKKKKAKTIKKKKTLKGMITMTEGTGKADWFKIRLSKRSRLRLNVSSICTGTSTNLKVEVIPANRHYTLLNSSVLIGTGGKKLRSRTKLNAGVYYIKVTKVQKSYSGIYAIKYLK